MSEQLNLFGDSFSELIESNINLYKIAEDANAAATATEISSNNEITNLSHALACLSSEDFERYVAAIRVIREVSIAYSHVSKIANIEKATNKITLRDGKNEIVKEKKPRKEPSIKKESSKTKFRNFLKEFLKNGSKRGRECMQAYLKECNEEYKDVDHTAINVSFGIYCQLHNESQGFVKKSGGVWTLKDEDIL